MVSGQGRRLRWLSVDLRVAMVYSLPEIHGGSVPRQTVEAAVADAYAARLTVGELLFEELEVALIPEDGVWACQVGEQKVEIPVAVEIVDGEAGAVAVAGANDFAVD
ncbi:MAG: hypothetical protein OXF50_22095 [Caldilineaceae bacterium]|nr:hypothetical protein [Caldilineaceae bacterium]